MSKAADDMAELEKMLASLPQKQYDDVKRCAEALSRVMASYDEAVATIALSIIGMLLQAEIERGKS